VLLAVIIFMTAKTEKIEDKENNRDMAFWLNSISLIGFRIAYFCSLYAVFHKRQTKKDDGIVVSDYPSLSISPKSLNGF
jgi:hypothetical protein